MLCTATRMSAILAASRGRVMCKNRSPLLLAGRAFKNAVITERMYDGAVSKRELILLYPSVCTIKEKDRALGPMRYTP